jgi:hypothetical protein
MLQGNLTTVGQMAGEKTPISIVMGIEICDGHILHLDPLIITCAINLPGSKIDRHQIDLGDDVNITKLSLGAGELICQGQIQVNP